MLRRAALRSSASLAGAPPATRSSSLHPQHVPTILPRNPQFQARHFLDLRKIAMADKIVIPASSAVRFPDLEVSFSDGRCHKLPIAYIPEKNSTDKSSGTIPSASLVCLSFRASSQKMTESWIVPFLDGFNTSGEIQVYEVSFVDSWLLSVGPMRRLFLKMMKKPDNPRKQVAYSFGDHYDFRKKLQILNLLTGYIFLLDKFGRIRWHGFGHATDEELSYLLSSTSSLLDEK